MCQPNKPVNYSIISHGEMSQRFLYLIIFTSARWHSHSNAKNLIDLFLKKSVSRLTYNFHKSMQTGNRFKDSCWIKKVNKENIICNKQITWF